MVEFSQRGCKQPGAPQAVGAWSRDIHDQVRAEQAQEKARALLLEQIRIGGIRAELWMDVTEGPRCGCYKLSNQQADRKCSACHGTGLVPGYLKFGYKTFHLSGVDEGVTLQDVRLTANFKSSKMELVPGALVGMMESPDYSFLRVAKGSHWEVDSQTFLRDPDTSVQVLYSLNSGGSWHDIELLSVANPSTGFIRFRVILSRTIADAISPLFEILRARYATLDTEDAGYEVIPRIGPWILIMREPPSTGYRKQEYGDIPIEENLPMWTAGLSSFDSSLKANSKEELIQGPAVLIRLMDGARAGNRYVAVDWKNSDPMAYQIVMQSFKMRIADPVEPMSLVF